MDWKQEVCQHTELFGTVEPLDRLISATRNDTLIAYVLLYLN